MMLFSGSRTFVLNVLNVKNLNAFMYTLCSYVLKLNNWKHLLFMTFLKSPDSLTHPILCQSMGAFSETCCYRKYNKDCTRPNTPPSPQQIMTWKHPSPPPVKKFQATPLERKLMINCFFWEHAGVLGPILPTRLVMVYAAMAGKLHTILWSCNQCFPSLWTP